MNTLTPEMHEGSDFSVLISALKERLGHEDAAADEPAPKPAAKEKTKKTKPSTPPVEEGDFSSYLTKVFRKLVRDGYEELEDERFGKIRFNKAFRKKTNYTFLVKLDEYHQFVTLEPGGLDEDSFIELEKEIIAYNKATSEKKSDWHYTVALILVNSVSDAVKELVYDSKPPKLGLTDLYATMIVIYSLEENDIFFPKVLPDGHNSNFEEKLDILKP